MEPDHRSLPESCTAMSVNLSGLLCFFGSLYAVKSFDMDPVNGAIFAIFALSAPIIILEAVFLKTYRRTSTGLDFSREQPADMGRVAVKLIGLYFTLGLAALYYWIFPEYRKPFYNPYWSLIMYVLPAIIAGAIPYFAFLDKYSEHSADSYWHMGLLATGRWAVVDKNIIVQHLLGWLVKAFFLAVMFSFFIGNMSFIKTHSFAVAFDNFGLFYSYMFNMIFAVDLVFVCAGYLLTLRILDSHMRSVEPTLLGWMAALVCYRPFWDFVYSNWLYYDDNYAWSNWLGADKPVYIAWGSAILFLLLVYVYATISFGIRFSNLTHRGILTNGPYRFMKHPAYASKNLAWWLIAIPFISRIGAADAILNSLQLLAVNLIYVVRAKTEEWHLSKDPVYVQYCTAMDSRSLLKIFAAKIFIKLKL